MTVRGPPESQLPGHVEGLLLPTPSIRQPWRWKRRHLANKSFICTTFAFDDDGNSCLTRNYANPFEQQKYLWRDRLICRSVKWVQFNEIDMLVNWPTNILLTQTYIWDSIIKICFCCCCSWNSDIWHNNASLCICRCKFQVEIDTLCYYLFLQTRPSSALPSLASRWHPPQNRFSTGCKPPLTHTHTHTHTHPHKQTHVEKGC